MSPLEFVALIAVGLAIGVYATAVGAGGGFLFAPLLLTRHTEAEPSEVAMASMCLVLASSGLAATRLARRGLVDYRAVGLVAAVAAPAAAFGAAATGLLPRSVFAAGFVALLSGLGVYLIIRPKGDAGQVGRGGWRRMLRSREGEIFLYWIPLQRSLIVSTGVAAVTALAGIGGGLFYSVITVRVMRMPVYLAVAASHGIVASIALVVVAFHTASGNWGDPLHDVPPLLIGALIANPVGLRVTARIGQSGLSRMLAAGLLLAAGRVAFEVV